MFNKKTYRLFTDYMNNQSELIINHLTNNENKFISKNTLFTDITDAFGDIKQDLTIPERRSFIQSTLTIISLLNEFVNIIMVRRFYSFLNEYGLNESDIKLYKKCLKSCLSTFVSNQSKIRLMHHSLGSTSYYVFDKLSGNENSFMNSFNNNVRLTFASLRQIDKDVEKMYSKFCKEFNKSEKIRNKHVKEIVKKSIGFLIKSESSMTDFENVFVSRFRKECQVPAIKDIKEAVDKAIEVLNGPDITNLMFKFNKNDYIDDLQKIEKTMIVSSHNLTIYILKKLETLIFMSRIEQYH